MKFMPFSYIRLGCFLFSLLLEGPAMAQTPLSLDQAIARTLENNFSIRIADLNTRVAENNNAWGAVGRLPRITFGANGSAYYTDNPATFAPTRLNASFGPSLNWTLFDGFRVQANKTRLDLLEAQSQGNAAIVIENALQAVILAYHNVLIAESQGQILQQVLKISRDRLAYEVYRRDLGTGSTFELLQFQQAVITDSTNWLSQQFTLRNVHRNLNLLMGEEVDTPFALTDPLPERFPQFALADLRQAMQSSNQNLKNQFLTNRILRQDIELARANLYPTLSLGAGINYSAGKVGLIDGRNITVGAFDYSANIALSFTLYDGGNIRRQIERARINDYIGKLQEEELLQSLDRDLTVSLDDYELRRRILALQTQNVSQSELNLSQANERFQNGLINSLDYRNVQIQYRNAQLGRLQALRDLKEAETELIRLTGGLVREG